MIDYTDHDFRPAAPGWRVVYLTDEARTDELFQVRDLAGWLVQLETTLDHFGSDEDPRPRHDRPRRVVAATVDHHGGDVYPCADDGHFWMVLGPSDRLPTEDEAAREIERRRTARGMAS